MCEREVAAERVSDQHRGAVERLEHVVEVGERCVAWLFGDGFGLVYKLLFLSFTFIGSVITAQAVLDFGDLMILGMAIPNVIGVVLLSGKVRVKLDEYMALKRAGEM